MSIPPTIAAELALTRQNIALSVIKSSNEQAQAVANILQKSADALKVSSQPRGANINIRA